MPDLTWPRPGAHSLLVSRAGHRTRSVASCECREKRQRRFLDGKFCRQASTTSGTSVARVRIRPQIRTLGTKDFNYDTFRIVSRYRTDSGCADTSLLRSRTMKIALYDAQRGIARGADLLNCASRLVVGQAKLPARNHLVSRSYRRQPNDAQRPLPHSELLTSHRQLGLSQERHITHHG